MLINRLVFAALCVALVHGDFKVYNGNAVESWSDNQFDFVVLLAGPSFCTGSLFTSSYIFTAAHCICNREMSPNVAVFERTGIKDGGYSIGIVAYYMNDNFTKYCDTNSKLSGTDSAVLQLQYPIEIAKRSISFAHYDEKFSLKFGDKVYLVGYGMDDSSDESKLTTLQTGRAVVAKCRPGDNIDSPICVQPSKRFKNQRTGQGDSGGPLVYVNEQDKKLVMGFLSGLSVYKNDVFFMLYASLQKNYDFLKNYL